MDELNLFQIYNKHTIVNKLPKNIIQDIFQYTNKWKGLKFERTHESYYNLCSAIVSGDKIIYTTYKLKLLAAIFSGQQI